MNTFQKLLKSNKPIFAFIKLPKHFRTPKPIQSKESIKVLSGDAWRSCPGFQIGKNQKNMLNLYCLIYFNNDDLHRRFF